MKNEWTQYQVMPCPCDKCTGYLLQNPYYHEYKCSDCGKYWYVKTEWVETNEPNKRVRRCK